MSEEDVLVVQNTYENQDRLAHKALSSFKKYVFQAGQDYILDNARAILTGELVSKANGNDLIPGPRSHAGTGVKGSPGANVISQIASGAVELYQSTRGPGTYEYYMRHFNKNYVFGGPIKKYGKQRTRNLKTNRLFRTNRKKTKDERRYLRYK